MITATKAKCVWPVAVLVALAAMCAATAEATIVTQDYGPFTVSFYGNGDSNGDETGAADWTSQQMADVGASIAAWDNNIANVPGRQIDLHMFWKSYSGSILGGSYSPTAGNGTNAYTYAEHVWRDGVNYDAAWDGWDSQITYDIDAAGGEWNFGSGTPTGSQTDFRSVVTHEIGHTLGFYETFDNTYDDWGYTYGTASSPYTGNGFGGLTAWDQNLVDSSGNRAQVNSSGTPGNFNQVDNPVYWDGAYAVAEYGANVPIYAPTTYSGGSSLSHLDQSTFPLALMSPFISDGDMVRSPTDLEWEMMRDMGWELGEVPEPGSLVMLAGLAGMSLLWYRRRRKQSS